MNWVLTLAQALGVYLGAGLLFGLAFLSLGLSRVDGAAVGSSWRFRLLILPGVAALWPLLALAWLRSDGDGPHDQEEAAA